MRREILFTLSEESKILQESDALYEEKEEGDAEATDVEAAEKDAEAVGSKSRLPAPTELTVPD